MRVLTIAEMLAVSGGCHVGKGRKVRGHKDNSNSGCSSGSRCTPAPTPAPTPPPPPFQV